MALFSKPKTRDVITLAIEPTDVRLLTLRNGKVDRWLSVDLPPGLVVEGLITNAVEMGKILDALFTAHNLPRKQVITSLSAMRSIPRLLTLPKLQASLMEEAISREARKEMPVSLESLYLAWQSMPGVGDQQRIYVVGVPREMIEAQVRALQAAGIPPFVMDLKPLALIRAIGQSEAIIVCLEDGLLDIVIVIDYLPAIMRTFSFEKEGLDALGQLERLLEELTQTVRFYNDSHREAMLQPSTSVYLAGRSLNTREAWDYLKATIDRPVERAVAPFPCPEELPEMEFMTNFGLALKKV